ncbi:hypothetical protein BAE44_0011671, partial [Dichanthelium oligosanthes]
LRRRRRLPEVEGGGPRTPRRPAALSPQARTKETQRLGVQIGANQLSPKPLPLPPQMEICDELRSFEATGVYRLDGTGTRTGAAFLDPVRLLNASYHRFRVVPSAYYSRSFEPPRQVGDPETEQPEKRRKRNRNGKPKPGELNAMERIAEARHQEARPLLLSAHESLIKDKYLLEYLSKTIEGKEHTLDVGSGSENNFVELGTSWRAPFYEISICFRKPHVLGNEEGSFHAQRTSFPLFNGIISVEAIDEVEGEFQNRHYILPRGSCFLMNTDAKQGSNFKLLEGSQVIMSVPGAHSRKPPLESILPCKYLSIPSFYNLEKTLMQYPLYVAFHDEEWGVPVHDDHMLFELLTLSQALAELTWPAILNKREGFREMFDGFNFASVSEFTEKKINLLRSNGSELLSEQKIRAVITNAKQAQKVQLFALAFNSSVEFINEEQGHRNAVVQEFGSFSNYCWSFVNHKPITNCFRYARQVPTKTPKAEAISKDLMRRGFQCVGPTTIYSFMQVAGIVNDHLSCCFRFKACSQHKASENNVRAEPALPDRRLSSPSSEDSDIREM